jgi:hypothetical protein
MPKTTLKGPTYLIKEENKKDPKVQTLMLMTILKLSSHLFLDCPSGISFSRFLSTNILYTSHIYGFLSIILHLSYVVLFLLLHTFSVYNLLPIICKCLCLCQFLISPLLLPQILLVLLYYLLEVVSIPSLLSGSMNTHDNLGMLAWDLWSSTQQELLIIVKWERNNLCQ